MSLFTINGFKPDVDVVTLERQASILDGSNAGRLKNGNMNRDVIGTYYNYGFAIHPGKTPEDYNKLYQEITTPTASCALELPFAQGLLSYDAYISEVTDSLLIANTWAGMAFTAVAIKPQRYPSDKWSIGVGSANTIFEIDGVGFDVSVTQLERTGSVLDSAASARSMSGVMSREVIGTYYNYSMSINPNTKNLKEYDTLYYALSAPVDSHRLKVLYGQGTISFNAYVSTVTDKLISWSEYGNVWGDLKVDFVAMQPERRPTA